MAELAQQYRSVSGEYAAQAAPPTRFHERILAEALTARGGDAARRVASALAESRIDLNPHQVEAAAFALDSLSRGGGMLADEVGLGKTIEAGLVLAQLASEGKTRLLVLCPATLRAQWQAELHDKFDLASVVIDGRSAAGLANPFDQPGRVVIASHPFAALRSELLAQLSFDVVVIDEAHRLRNAHRPNNKTGRALRAGLRASPKLLLTATPLQNDLSELFGLLSLLDEQILGPEQVFKSHFSPDKDGALSESSTTELKQRLSPVVQRTLRRQVREYVRFTNRRSIVEDFAPSAEEQSLYEDVSEYLRRGEAAAIEPGQRTLLLLVYRKLLASSTYAIAPTLRQLADTLEKRLAGRKLEEKASALLGADEWSAYAEEAEAWSDEPAREVGIKALEREVWELRQYADRADKIRVNAKGEALKRALDRVFTVARAHQWPEKAVVFTESRRTQAYLFDLLSAHGFAGRISVLSGDAGTVEERRALVQEFRDQTQILLSTEAGAEGLNLQFCNLVVNYDLPWNPQRVEQRIGRCHRYGQQRDVLVINFVNRSNAADARLFELLEKKLNLFDGVFGASDEILGALESGVDFEKRVLDIYQSCRRPEEIDAAFQALRDDLETRIDRRMTEARSMLLERFDGEVRRRLKVAADEAKVAVARRRADAQALTGAVLGSLGTRHEQVVQAAGAVKGRATEGVCYLALDAATLPAKLAHLAGREGWWFAYRFEASGLRPEDRLVHLVLLRDGDRFKALSAADGEAFVRLAAREEAARKMPAVSVALAQESALNALRAEFQREVERKSCFEHDAARERADRFAEDCLLEPREQTEQARLEWEQARAAFIGKFDAAERVKARAQLERLEREYRKRLQGLRSNEDQRYADKDRALAELANRAKVTVGRSLVASAYFWLR